VNEGGRRADELRKAGARRRELESRLQRGQRGIRNKRERIDHVIEYGLLRDTRELVLKGIKLEEFGIRIMGENINRIRRAERGVKTVRKGIDFWDGWKAGDGRKALAVHFRDRETSHFNGRLNE
jgi:hypothetical protein